MRVVKRSWLTFGFAALFVLSTPSYASVQVKGGSFTPLYGSQKQPVKVADFRIDEFPVTNSEFLSFVKRQTDWQRSKRRSLFADATYLQAWKSDLVLGPKAPSDSPVVNVSWFAAKAYCADLGGRLPTVTEWEYIASRPIKGVDVNRLILDWYSQPTPETIPSVKKGLKNESGVSALHGLIWEWTLDFNSAMVTGESRGDASLEKTLYCGAGSTGAADPSDYAAFMRFAYRSSLKAKYTVNNLGFRCVYERGTP